MGEVQQVSSASGLGRRRGRGGSCLVASGDYWRCPGRAICGYFVEERERGSHLNRHKGE